MKITAKIAFAAIALLTIAVASACGGSKIPSAATNGNNGATATSPAGSGASAAGDNTSTGGGGPAKTSTAPGTSGSEGSTTTAAATYNEVVLGAEFNGAPYVSFGNLLPGQSATMPFRVGNLSGQSVTVVSVTTDIAAFSPSRDCDGRVLVPGGTCTFSVTFGPADSGTYSSALNIAVTPSIVAQGPALKGSVGSATVSSQASSPPASQLAPAGSSSP